MKKYTSLALLAGFALMSAVITGVSADNSHGEWKKYEKNTHEKRQSLGYSGSTSLSGAQLECVRTAVTTRETTVKKSYSTLSSVYLTGLDTRLQSLSTAWTLTDRVARKEARENAWNTWNTTARNARELFKQEKKGAWETFRNAVKACRVHPSEVESSSMQNADVQ